MDRHRPLSPNPARNGGAAEPIDVAVQSSGRRSFWSRIATRRSRTAALQATLQSGVPAASESLHTRLGSIEEKLESVEASIDLASQRLETRMLQFWEIEEQLGQVSRRLSELDASAREVSLRSARISKAVTFVAVLAVTILAGLGVLLALALGFPSGT
jgi:septal ring factor EnvC (AmiA/AmiB activator)